MRVCFCFLSKLRSISTYLRRALLSATPLVKNLVTYRDRVSMLYEWRLFTTGCTCTMSIYIYLFYERLDSSIRLKDPRTGSQPGLSRPSAAPLWSMENNLTTFVEGKLWIWRFKFNRFEVRDWRIFFNGPCDCFGCERGFVHGWKSLCRKGHASYHQPCHGADAIAGSQGCSYSRHLKVVHSFVVVMLT